MGVCDPKKIKKNLKRCGQKALAKGVDETVLLGMRDAQEIAFTYDATNSTIITGIALKTGEKLFAYEGRNYSNDFSVGSAETEFDFTLPQTAVLMIFSNSPATKLEIEALLSRKDLILITKRTAGDYEVYGAETGMRRTSFVYRPNDDNKGAFVVTLGAPEEISLPKTLLHKTDPGGLEDTTSYLATLTTADA
ncbi:hypothetical protein [Spirosoma fluminis]